MATQKKSTALARLIPNSKLVVVDGQGIRVAADKQENDIMNMILAGVMREFLHEAIKRYKDKDMTPSPKELKDLMDGAAKMVEFSGNVYKPESSIPDGDEKKVEKTDGQVVNFEKLSPAIDVEVEEKK